MIKVILKPPTPKRHIIKCAGDSRIPIGVGIKPSPKTLTGPPLPLAAPFLCEKCARNNLSEEESRKNEIKHHQKWQMQCLL